MVTITALNGRLPAGKLVLIERGQSLRPDAAASWHRMEAAGMPRGCLRSGYRDLNAQAVLVLAGQTVATAGTSFHGEGTAADVDEPARSWIALHGAPHGYISGRVPRESWHKEFDPTRDQHAATTAPAKPVTVIPALPTPLDQEEPPMKPFIIVGGTGQNRGIALVRPWLTGEIAVKSFTGEEWGIYSAKVQPIESIPTVTLAAREWDIIKAFHTQGV